MTNQSDEIDKLLASNLEQRVYLVDMSLCCLKDSLWSLEKFFMNPLAFFGLFTMTMICWETFFCFNIFTLSINSRNFKSSCLCHCDSFYGCSELDFFVECHHGIPELKASPYLSTYEYETRISHSRDMPLCPYFTLRSSHSHPKKGQNESEELLCLLHTYSPILY